MGRHMPSGGGSGDGDGTLPNVADIKYLWNAWEIHILILVSLFLQFVLFFFAGLRRRSTSSILRSVLWLAYLSADAVATFALGNLVVHAEGPRHHLMYFWAPFTLVHLGGQDTITAFSKQDNELWNRHLLNLVTQVAVAGYVVAKASWPDSRLRAAMVIMFLSGCFKYAERTFCLYSSSPQCLTSECVDSLSDTLRALTSTEDLIEDAGRLMLTTLVQMGKGTNIFDEESDEYWYSLGNVRVMSLISEDAPYREPETILVAGNISAMLAEFKCRAGRCGAYTYVGACLEFCYQRFHTKTQIRRGLYRMVKDIKWSDLSDPGTIIYALICSFIIFQHLSAPTALVLFIFAEKGGRLVTSRADIIVSWILLVGAIVLDVCSFFSILRYLADGRIKRAVFGVANCIQPGTRKNWAEKLAQYNMIETEVLLLQSSWPRYRRLVARLFGKTTYIPITTLQEFILDDLLSLGAREVWDITSSRGKLSLQKWMASHQQGPNSTLEKSISVDFPISVIIWHIATSMCYYFDDNSTTGIKINKKQVSRELSNYIMYLVFTCGVQRTTSSQYVLDTAEREISEILRNSHQQGNLDEKDAVTKVYVYKEEKQEHSTGEIQKSEELVGEQQQATEIQKSEELVGEQQQATEIQNYLQNFLQSNLEGIREVARELNNIQNAAERWDLIVGVWSEMLYYVAPRCGSAFHYEHLSTGGEFITHVLALMKLLGPFLPRPRA